MGQKQKTEKKKKERKKERLNNGDNNGQATHGARKHAWCTHGARKPPGLKLTVLASSKIPVILAHMGMSKSTISNVTGRYITNFFNMKISTRFSKFAKPKFIKLTNNLSSHFSEKYDWL